MKKILIVFMMILGAISVNSTLIVSAEEESNKDIDTITKIIGDEFDDVQSLKTKLLQNSTKINDNISFISKYIINSLRYK